MVSMHFKPTSSVTPQCDLTLKACMSARASWRWRQVHDPIDEPLLERTKSVLSTWLIKLIQRTGLLPKSRLEFREYYGPFIFSRAGGGSE